MPEPTTPRAVVTGGAGFLGSHLCERLLREGWGVICVDSFLTGDPTNLAGYRDRRGFSLSRADVTQELPVDGPVHAVLHLASAASPVMYLRHPIETLRVGSLGTERALELAAREGAVFVLASTSEVYGDPEVHPQPESYRGSVSPIGPRSVYDEAKRYAEALAMAYHRARGVSIRIARIFNTYGPRMRMDDGRAVPTFILQGLRGEPITVHGDGSQTRSLCYVDDLIEGFWRLLNSDQVGPINLGSPHEVKVLEIAEQVRALTAGTSEIVFVDRPEDDPERRRPDITLATSVLGWTPEVDLADGLSRTVAWAKQAWT